MCRTQEGERGSPLTDFGLIAIRSVRRSSLQAGKAVDISHLLSVSITPVVLISACGLLTQSLYNHLGIILTRIRSFHKQKIELLENLHKHEAVEQQMLLEMLDSQIVQVTVKARVIQKGLYCLLAAISSFLLCSLFAGIALIHEWVGSLALAMGVVGMTLFLVGLGWAMRELTLSLAPLEKEHTDLDVLTAYCLKKSQGTKPLKIAESA